MQAMSDLTAYTDAFSPSATEPAWLAERRRGALARFGELTVRIGAPLSFPLGTSAEAVARKLENVVRTL